VQGLSSNRIATYRYAALPALLAFLPGAAFADSAACPANSASLDCRLLGFLHWLEAAAWVLVILLLIVIGIVIHVIRKNRLSRKEGR
jgi:disulfide bond formation protein DsbB